MNLFESMKIAESLQEKALVVWQHYESRKLNSEFEPKWTHSAYESVKKYIDGVAADDDRQLVHEILSSHGLKDGYSVPAFPGMPQSPMRIIHDGWKSGTPTWIFMGRSFPDAVQELGNGWIAVRRTLPLDFYKLIDNTAAPATLWIAYHLDHQMGTSALTSNCVGPAFSLEQLRQAIESE